MFPKVSLDVGLWENAAWVSFSFFFLKKKVVTINHWRTCSQTPSMEDPESHVPLVENIRKWSLL